MPRSRTTGTANDRFKASWNRILGASIFGAVAIEVALLMASPEFTVPVEYRMIVVVDSMQNVEWQETASAGRPEPVRHKPRIQNLGSLHSRLHAVYPRTLWDVRFENALTVRVSIDEEGNLTDVTVAEPGLDLAADEAILALARELKFSPATIDGVAVPVKALLRLSVEVPVYDEDTDWTEVLK